MADVLDVVTLDEAKRSINMESVTSEQDDILARHITAVSRLIDETCGPVVQRAVGPEIHDGTASGKVFLRRWPVSSIGLVRESRGGVIVTLPPSPFGSLVDGFYAVPYTADPTLLSGTLVRRWGAYDAPWWFGPASIEVTYVAGRVADTDHVDARFKDAAGSILRRLWKREAGTWAQSSDFFVAGDTTAGTGFYRVAQPIIDEMLWADKQPLVAV